MSNLPPTYSSSHPHPQSDPPHSSHSSHSASQSSHNSCSYADEPYLGQTYRAPTTPTTPNTAIQNTAELPPPPGYGYLYDQHPPLPGGGNGSGNGGGNGNTSGSGIISSVNRKTLPPIPPTPSTPTSAAPGSGGGVSEFGLGAGRPTTPTTAGVGSLGRGGRPLPSRPGGGGGENGYGYGNGPGNGVGAGAGGGGDSYGNGHGHGHGARAASGSYRPLPPNPSPSGSPASSNNNNNNYGNGPVDSATIPTNSTSSTFTSTSQTNGSTTIHHAHTASTSTPTPIQDTRLTNTGGYTSFNSGQDAAYPGGGGVAASYPSYTTQPINAGATPTSPSGPIPSTAYSTYPGYSSLPPFSPGGGMDMNMNMQMLQMSQMGMGMGQMGMGMGWPGMGMGMNYPGMGIMPPPPLGAGMGVGGSLPPLSPTAGSGVGVGGGGGGMYMPPPLSPPTTMGYYPPPPTTHGSAPVPPPFGMGLPPGYGIGTPSTPVNAANANGSGLEGLMRTPTSSARGKEKEREGTGGGGNGRGSGDGDSPAPPPPPSMFALPPLSSLSLASSTTTNDSQSLYPAGNSVSNTHTYQQDGYGRSVGPAPVLGYDAGQVTPRPLGHQQSDYFGGGLTANGQGQDEVSDLPYMQHNHQGSQESTTPSTGTGMTSPTSYVDSPLNLSRHASTNGTSVTSGHGSRTLDRMDSRMRKSRGSDYLASLSVGAGVGRGAVGTPESIREEGGYGAGGAEVLAGSGGQMGQGYGAGDQQQQVGSNGNYPYAANVDYRESVVSLNPSERTFGEGPSHIPIEPRDRDRNDPNRESILAPSWIEQTQDGQTQPSRWVQNKLFLHQSHQAGFSPQELPEGAAVDDYFEEGYDDFEEEEVEEQNEMNFFSPSLLSHVSVQLRDRVERNIHVKSGIAWPNSFTGRDIITTIQSFMPEYTRTSSNDRRFAQQVALSLQKQLLFVEVDWNDRPLIDSLEDVYQFMNETEGLIGTTYEFPTGVETMAAKCYSPSCQGAPGCYSPMCPFKISPETFLQVPLKSAGPSRADETRSSWLNNIDQALLQSLSESEKKRQAIIHQAIQLEEQYEADLNAVETLFISPLRLSQPPVIRSLKDLEELISDLFGNILELREANSRLLEFFAVRQREQGGIISTIGDGYLIAASEFRNLYPDYIGRLPRAEERLRDELANNANFRLFVDRVVRQNENRRMDIKYLITRPATQLNRYPQILEAILKETPDDNPDAGFLVEATRVIRNMSLTAQLKVWQHSTNREADVVRTEDALVRRERAANQASLHDKLWSDFVSVEEQAMTSDEEKKTQQVIFELIKSEMLYVADLRIIETVYIDGLRSSDEPIIDRSRLEVFLDEVFHNYRSLLDIHADLLEKLHARQEEQHPRVGPIGDLIYDAALRWQDAIIEYGSHYPKAKYAWDQERAVNPAFAAFLEKCQSAPGTGRQDIEHFVNRPVPRLLRYPMILREISKSLEKSGQVDHLDVFTIPEVLELIGSQGKVIDKGVAESTAKVALWALPATLSGGKFGDEVVNDLDLKNPTRELIHKGRVYRQPEGTISSTWAELHAFLFNNFFVLSKTGKSKTVGDAPVKYYINRKPIPLELLTLGTFTDPPQTRNIGLLRGLRSDRHESSNNVTGGTDSDSRAVYPFTFTFMGSGQFGGQYTLWTDSAATRLEWHEKFQHAKALRNADIEANKIFELNSLARDTFYASTIYGAPTASRPDEHVPLTGRVTCSAPFRTVDNRELVAIGCAEGVWIGLRSDPRSLRKVLHVKAVTHCAVLEQFSLFLVLSNKTLLAYPMESLVPSSQSNGPPPRGHQKLSDKHEVEYFACGQLSGRTLVVYLRKKGTQSYFRCLEPVTGRDMDENRNRRNFGSLLNAKNDWFRIYKDFYVPSEATHLHFFRNKLIVVCQKGFEIIDMTVLDPAAIPVFDSGRLRSDAALASLKSRCEATAKPLGVFRSTENEFLLVYDSFGFFVDRHGFPNRDLRAIEWEGRPESVGFHPPYVVLFSAPFLEIRHINDGRLLQIYCAKDLNGSSANPEHGVPVPRADGYTEDMISPEPRLHIVQRSSNQQGAPRNAVCQDVYELCPTLLLNNPLRDATPRDATYFPPAPEVQRYSNGGPSNQYGYMPWR